MPSAAHAPPLASSPSDALTRNTDGYCDFLDAGGAVVGGGTTAPADAAYVRRWSIDSIATTFGVAIAVRVVAVDARHGGIDAHIDALVRYAP